MTRTTPCLFLLLGCLAACETRARSENPAAESSAALAASGEERVAAAEPACGAHAVAETNAPGAACGEHAADGQQAAPTEAACGAAEPGGCGACGGGTEPVAGAPAERVVDPATGAAIDRVGARMSGLTPVSVAELLAHPDAYAGKTVRLEGDVAAMCHHRRMWFALQQTGDRSGRAVRIFGAPAFLVPPGSVGRKARTEGVVELVEVPASARSHLAAEHGLAGEPSPKTVLIRATGAEFI